MRMLRLRLLIGPSAPELHRLRWERCAIPAAAGRCSPVEAPASRAI